MGLLGTQDRPLVLPPGLVLEVATDRSLYLLNTPQPPVSRVAGRPSGGGEAETFGLRGEEMKQNRDNCSHLTTFSNQEPVLVDSLIC